MFWNCFPINLSNQDLKFFSCKSDTRHETTDVDMLEKMWIFLSSKPNLHLSTFICQPISFILHPSSFKLHTSQFCHFQTFQLVNIALNTFWLDSEKLSEMTPYVFCIHFLNVSLKPSCLSVIIPINNHSYQLLNLSAIIAIDHHAYLPSCLWSIRILRFWNCSPIFSVLFVTFKLFRLFTYFFPKASLTPVPLTCLGQKK